MSILTNLRFVIGYKQAGKQMWILQSKSKIPGNKNKNKTEEKPNKIMHVS